MIGVSVSSPGKWISVSLRSLIEWWWPPLKSIHNNLFILSWRTIARQKTITFSLYSPSLLFLRNGYIHSPVNLFTRSSPHPPPSPRIPPWAKYTNHHIHKAPLYLQPGLNSNLAGVSLSVCSLCCCPVTSPVSADAAGAWRAGQAISQIFRIVGNFFVHATHRIPMVEMLFMSFCAPHHRLLLHCGSLSCLDGVLFLRSTLTLPLHV